MKAIIQLSRRTVLKGSALQAIGSLSAFSLPTQARAIETSSMTYQRPKLKITDVRTAQVNVHGPQTHIRIYTDAGQIDARWTPEIVADCHQWLKENEDHLSVPKSTIEEILSGSNPSN